MGDFVSVRNAVGAYITAARRDDDKVDLTLGAAGTLLGCALLLEAIPATPIVDLEPLVRLGDRVSARLRERLDGFRPSSESPIGLNLGMAHGWAGVLYAGMRWHLAARRTSPNDWIDLGLRQLAELAEPDARGLRWPWIGTQSHAQHHGYMSGWCNGSAGFVHLWLTASQTFGIERYRDLAVAAGWNAWEDASSESVDLCCGFAGRAYAMLALYRSTGDPDWLHRARQHASWTMDHDVEMAASPSNASLFKGRLGCALLAAELEFPEAARMPLFEAEGWPAR
jgi:serine/threonine-protein kinase